MQTKVTVLRHFRENVKKCSLRFLHDNPNFEFIKAKPPFEFDATGYTLLEIDAPQISPADLGRPVLLLDSTWHLLPQLRRGITGKFVPRSLPSALKTAYPRKSKVFCDPSRGLATIEALYAALRLMGDTDFGGILENYRFAEDFLSTNRDLL